MDALSQIVITIFYTFKHTSYQLYDNLDIITHYPQTHYLQTGGDMELTIELLGVLFLVAGVAGFVDAIAGGGGLLTIPMLMLMLTNMPIVSVLATNKLQASAGSLSASIAMIKKAWHTHPR